MQLWSVFVNCSSRMLDVTAFSSRTGNCRRPVDYDFFEGSTRAVFPLRFTTRLVPDLIATSRALFAARSSAAWELRRSGSFASEIGLFFIAIRSIQEARLIHQSYCTRPNCLRLAYIRVLSSKGLSQIAF